MLFNCSYALSKYFTAPFEATSFLVVSSPNYLPLNLVVIKLNPKYVLLSEMFCNKVEASIITALSSLAMKDTMVAGVAVSTNSFAPPIERSG